MLRRVFAVTIVALLAAGCSTPGGSVPAPLPLGAAHAAAVTLKISVPQASAQQRRARTPAFIASQTQSITVVVTSGTTHLVVLSTTFNVTSTTNGCTTVTTFTTVTTCTETFALAPDSYTADFSTYDGPNGSGNKLSQTTSLSFTAQLGVANAIPVILYGIPHSIVITPSSTTIIGSQVGGFTVYGSLEQYFNVQAKDADGNIIIGSGPFWNVTTSSGSGFNISQPPSSGASQVGIYPTGNVSESFVATASFGDSTVCSQPGAVCTGTFSASRQQLLFFDDPTTNYLVKMASPINNYGSTSIIYSNAGAPSGYWLGTDDNGNLYLYDTGKVHVFSPPSYVQSNVFLASGGSNGLANMAVDSSGDVFFVAGASLIEYKAPSYGTPTTTTTSVSPGTFIAIRGTVLAITDGAGQSVEAFSLPNVTALGHTAGNAGTNLGHESIDVDSLGDIIVANAGGAIQYLPAGSYSAFPTQLTGCSTAGEVQFDSSNDLFCGTGSGYTMAKLAAGFTASTASTSLGGVASPRFRFDANNNAFAYSTSGSLSGVNRYANGFTGAGVNIASGSSFNGYDLVLTP